MEMQWTIQMKSLASWILEAEEKGGWYQKVVRAGRGDKSDEGNYSGQEYHLTGEKCWHVFLICFLLVYGIIRNTFSNVFERSIFSFMWIVIYITCQFFCWVLVFVFFSFSFSLRFLNLSFFSKEISPLGYNLQIFSQFVIVYWLLCVCMCVCVCIHILTS